MGKYKQIPINLIYVKDSDEKINIRKHPYYLCLKNKDQHVYQKFIKNTNRVQQRKKSGTWKGFLKLVTSIHREGYQYDKYDPLVIKEYGSRYIAKHGRHRTCILAYLYGVDGVFIAKKQSNEKYHIVGAKLSYANVHTHQRIR